MTEGLKREMFSCYHSITGEEEAAIITVTSITYFLYPAESRGLFPGWKWGLCVLELPIK